MYAAVQSAHDAVVYARDSSSSVEEAAAQGVGMGWSLGEDGMFGVVRRKVDDEAEALGMDAVEKLSALMVHVTDIAGPDEDEE